ncbi:unnamed protein product, partial [Mesorhabditis spiculigera]
MASSNNSNNPPKSPRKFAKRSSEADGEIEDILKLLCSDLKNSDQRVPSQFHFAKTAAAVQVSQAEGNSSF